MPKKKGPTQAAGQSRMLSWRTIRVFTQSYLTSDREPLLEFAPAAFDDGWRDARPRPPQVQDRRFRVGRT